MFTYSTGVAALVTFAVLAPSVNAAATTGTNDVAKLLIKGGVYDINGLNENGLSHFEMLMKQTEQTIGYAADSINNTDDGGYNAGGFDDGYDVDEVDDVEEEEEEETESDSDVLNTIVPSEDLILCDQHEGTYYYEGCGGSYYRTSFSCNDQSECTFTETNLESFSVQSGSYDQDDISMYDGNCALGYDSNDGILLDEGNYTTTYRFRAIFSYEEVVLNFKKEGNAKYDLRNTRYAVTTEPSGGSIETFGAVQDRYTY